MRVFLGLIIRGRWGRVKDIPPSLWQVALEEAFATALDLPQLRGRPVFIGEFGAGGERHGAGGLEWTRDVLEIMNRYGLHYTYHNYRHPVHQGYWIRRPPASQALAENLRAILSGEMQYADLSDEQKRDLFSTPSTSYLRPGIKEILMHAFQSAP